MARSTATTSGRSGIARSCPVLIRQPSSVLFRTCNQPRSRSTSSISRCVNSPTRRPVLARVKWIGYAQSDAASKKASSMVSSKTRIGLASSTRKRSNGSSEKGLPKYGGMWRRLMAKLYMERHVSRMNRSPLSRSFLFVECLWPFGATSVWRRQLANPSGLTSWASGVRFCSFAKFSTCLVAARYRFTVPTDELSTCSW